MSITEWCTAGASVRGKSHERADLPCQDACLWTVLPEGIVVAAIADGAGSAAFAETGAQTAVAAAVDAACQRLVSTSVGSFHDRTTDEELRLLLTGALNAARTAVQTQAETHSLLVRDLSSTLILVVASVDFIAAVQVGDGAVVAASTEGQVFSVTHPARGEYLNETVFLTSPQGCATAQSTVWRGPVAHLAVFSDGLQMVALRMPSGEAYEGFFSPLFRFLRMHEDETEAQHALVSFLMSPRLRERTDDDVTLFLATWIP
jgi:hypothetical protein